MLKYESLSPEMENIIRKNFTENLSEYAFSSEAAIRRNSGHDRPTFIRPAFVRDADKIVHCPYFGRYADKTQVFSFYKNDDISRRSLHVQLVSRIARTIGRALCLNLDLIEAIALGHDMGHTPFGHTGERFLDDLLKSHTGRRFNHNIQSVRVLDKIFPYNITLQTLDGIACHNGELELSEYRPYVGKTFEEFDQEIEQCFIDSDYIKKLVPSTLEACVVRVSDIIAYLGKDRQDAERANVDIENVFEDDAIGTNNAEIINNLVVNIVENSFGKPYIKMDDIHFNALKKAKADNYDLIYFGSTAQTPQYKTVERMMKEIYESLLDDLKADRKISPIFTHHIDYVNKAHYTRTVPYESTEPNQLVTDYIASMTDDYFIELYKYMFPDSSLSIEYIGYFDE
ncbi:MAG: HD domain-containing protein [Lachnospiraceae bacterium]|nr:HD domain-containing protein [Lachnospiraceae bacterium]